MWVLTAKEEARLLEECAKRPQHQKYLTDLVLFALNSGMRLGEIQGLRKADINLSKRFVLVRDTKNHESRKVPVNDSLKAAIKRRLKVNESEFLFSQKNGRRLTVLTNAFWTAVDKAGLTRQETDDRGEMVAIRFSFHDLRHTFGSRLGMAGADLKTIMEIMGHKTPKMSMRYQHPTPSHKLNAVHKLYFRNRYKDKKQCNIKLLDIIGMHANQLMSMKSIGHTLIFSNSSRYLMTGGTEYGTNLLYHGKKTETSSKSPYVAKKSKI